jgi:hypothetical protein
MSIRKVSLDIQRRLTSLKRHTRFFTKLQRSLFSGEDIAIEEPFVLRFTSTKIGGGGQELFFGPSRRTLDGLHIWELIES